VKENGEVDW